MRSASPAAAERTNPSVGGAEGAAHGGLVDDDGRGEVENIVDVGARKLGQKAAEAFNLLPLLLIGVAQAFAIMPGVSRSGVTITAALLLGFGRRESARVSFLLSIPIIAGAAVLKLKDISLAEVNTPFICGFLGFSTPVIECKPLLTNS